MDLLDFKLHLLWCHAINRIIRCDHPCHESKRKDSHSKSSCQHLLALSDEEIIAEQLLVFFLVRKQKLFCFRGPPKQPRKLSCTTTDVNSGRTLYSVPYRSVPTKH